MIDVLSKKNSGKPCNTIDTLVGVNTQIKGDISFTGGLRIDGKINGNITAKSDSSSTLVISEHALITGDVTVPHLVINGQIKGNVHSAQSIEMQAKAEIIGDVSYKMIEMALGASVNGNLVRQDVEPGKQAAPVTRLKQVGGGETEK